MLAARLQRIKPAPSAMAGQGARALRAQDCDIVGLTAGEPDFETPDHIKDAATLAMAKGATRYTDEGGTPPPPPLNAQNLAVPQGTADGLPNHFRLSFAASDENWPKDAGAS